MEPGIPHGDSSETGQKNKRKHCTKKKKNCSDKERDLQIPQWFLDNYVESVHELAASNVPLVIREDTSVGHTTSQTSDLSESDGSDIYEVRSAVYKPLRDILTIVEPQQRHKLKENRFFKYNIVYLRFPENGEVKGGIIFFITIVKHFARDVRANLITLCAEDFINLIKYFTGIVPGKTVKDHHNSYYGNYNQDLFSNLNLSLDEIYFSPLKRKVITARKIKT